MPRRAPAFVLIGFSLLAFACSSFYVIDYLREQRELRRFLAERSGPPQSSGPLALVTDLTTWLGSLPGDETTGRMGYRNPLYRVLKARPIDVLHYGGFCGNKSRLLVTLLEMKGIDARVAYLYNKAGEEDPKALQPYVNAFVEVGLDGRWVVADPLLGVVFKRADLQPATAEDLAADLSLVAAQAPSWYEPEVFNYQDIRGIRWNKFPGGERLRAALLGLGLEGWVESLHYPSWAHRPNLLLAGGAGVIGVALGWAGLAFVRPRRRNSMRGLAS